MSKMVFSIQYAGMYLPVVKNERGEDCTPLKPISDLFGLRWRQQLEKVSNGDYLSRYLGVCTLDTWGAGGQNRAQTCILVSRVAAYLMGINPEKVHVSGNVDGAKFLMEKQSEWADALHDYEELGLAVNLNHARAQEVLRKQRAAFAQMLMVKQRVEDPVDRKAAGRVAAQMAAELGVPYQMDLGSGE